MKTYSIYKENGDKTLTFTTSEIVNTKYINNKLKEFDFPIDDYILSIQTIEEDKVIAGRIVYLSLLSQPYELTRFYEFEKEKVHCEVDYGTLTELSKLLKDALNKDKVMVHISLKEHDFDYAINPIVSYIDIENVGVYNPYRDIIIEELIGITKTIE